MEITFSLYFYEATCKYFLFSDLLARRNYTFLRHFGYYRVYTTPANWTNARETCKRDGADLVVANNSAELNAILGLLPCHGSPNFYIGVYYYEEYEQFGTVFGM